MSAFDRIIGYAAVKAEMERFCDVLKNPDKYKKLGVTMPRGILLEGEPGIGKTLMAKCFIEESGCKSYLLRKNRPDGDFVNEIRSTFEKARSESRAIVFLDDMDKYANEDPEHADAEEYVAIQACIDDCADTEVFVIATINFRYCLPDSLIRAGRFDKVIFMRAPRGEDSRNIVKYYLSQKQVMGDVDIEELAGLMEGNSCAELESVINEAAINAGFEGREQIEQKDILQALYRMIFDAPKSIDENERKYLKNIAVHEAGHAVVSEVLEPGSVSLVSVVNYSGSTEGVTVIRKPDDFNISMIAQEHEVIRKLGGKAATELIFGVGDTGCRCDIRDAIKIITRFVSDYCFYGFNSFNSINGECESDYILENRDRIISEELDKYYRQAKQIIIENRELFDILTRELIERKTLTHKDIVAIKEKCIKNIEITTGSCTI